MDSQTFDALVAGFYRAATGEIAWDEALTGVQEAFAARTAVLHTVDLTNGHLLGLHGGGHDPWVHEAIYNYIRDFHLIDPRRLRALQQGPDGFAKWAHCHESFDPKFVERDAFFQHYLLGYDMRYNSNVLLPVSDSVATAFIFELPAERGPLSADERYIAQRLGEHMHDALRAHERVRRLTAQALAGQGLLHSFPYPMWLIDRDRFIRYENPAAAQESAQETRVAKRASRLALIRSRSDQQLTEHLHRLGGHGASAVIDLRRTLADAPTWLHLSRLEPAEALGVFGDQPRVLATLFDPAHVSALDPFALSNMFGLTPTEAQVAVRMANGSSAEDISIALGSSMGTVRVHIKRVIAKLGATRAVDAVRMLRQGEALWSGAGKRTGEL